MEDHTSVRTAKPRKSMKTNETTTMLAKRTPLQTNGERRGVRGGKRIDAKYRGEGRRKVERARLVQGTHDM